jgi:hypothetical protein
MTLTIELSEPYEAMLEELRKNGQSNPDADLRQLVEDAIHNGYQQSQSGQS